MNLRNYTCCVRAQLIAAARGNDLQSEGATALAVSLSCLSNLGALLLRYVAFTWHTIQQKPVGQLVGKLANSVGRSLPTSSVLLVSLFDLKL